MTEELDRRVRQVLLSYIHKAIKPPRQRPVVVVEDIAGGRPILLQAAGKSTSSRLLDWRGRWRNFQHHKH